jgi:hypothetical protein
MRLERVIYVSEWRIDVVDIEAVMAKLVTDARSRNAHLAVSGALLFTGTHFAQILEGLASSLALILSALRQDPRHSNIHVAAHHSISARIFSGWHMAYHGPSQYVAEHVKRLLSDGSEADQRQNAERFTRLVIEFLATPHPV